MAPTPAKPAPPDSEVEQLVQLANAAIRPMLELGEAMKRVDAQWGELTEAQKQRLGPAVHALVEEMNRI